MVGIVWGWCHFRMKKNKLTSLSSTNWTKAPLTSQSRIFFLNITFLLNYPLESVSNKTHFQFSNKPS